MSVTDYSRVLYEENGRIRHTENWRIYALFCKRTETDALVKIGISSIVYDRMVQLLPGLMYPISVVMHLPIGDRQAAAAFEATIHRCFKEKRTRGEWFEFNLADEDDKALFNGAFRMAWATHIPSYGGLLKWERITGKQIAAHHTNRSNEQRDRKARRGKAAWGKVA